MITAALDIDVLTSFGEIFDVWKKGWFEVVTSRAILAEVERALQKIPSKTRRRFLTFLYNETIITPITVKDESAVVAAALSARADFTVTDEQLPRFYHGTLVLRPADFLETLDDIMGE